jgi:hypothetical protein
LVDDAPHRSDGAPPARLDRFMHVGVPVDPMGDGAVSKRRSALLTLDSLLSFSRIFALPVST